ncbi:MAG: ATP-binding protein [Actinomycetota bacterium]|nr:ATP-binding protein [Actinomycetota bacterium]
MAIENPYSYGGPVRGQHFIGRDAEVADLVSRMANGISVVVTAPRRYGKTSLIDRAAELVHKDRGAVISVNLMHCPSLDAFASRLVGGAYTTEGGRMRRARQGLPELLRRLRLQPAFTLDDAGRPRFTFGGLAERDAIVVLDDVYAILSALAEERPAVLILDEFQAVGELGGGIAPAIKALGDRHPKVSLVVAGSRQHLMDALVLARGAPLYNMAERLALGSIDERVMVRYLRNRARHGAKDMSEGAARRICELAGPVPYDIQRLAYGVFDQAGDQLDTSAVDGGMSGVIRREDPNFTESFSRMSIRHRRVLVGIAGRRRVEQPYTAELAREVGYAGPPGVRRAIEALGADETLTQRQGALVVADPFFAEWLRRL